MASLIIRSLCAQIWVILKKSGEKTTTTTKFGQFFSLIVRNFFFIIIFNFRLNGCLASRQLKFQFKSHEKKTPNWMKYQQYQMLWRITFSMDTLFGPFTIYIYIYITCNHIDRCANDICRTIFELLEKFPFGLIGKYLPWQRKQSSFNSHFKRSSSSQRILKWHCSHVSHSM